MHRFLDSANALTLTSLLAGFGCVILAINGFTGFALIALMLSGICDLFDGMVAKGLVRDAQQQRFGGILDALVDGCAFGFAPSVMLYATGMSSFVEVIVLATLPICVIWRVAYFEVTGLHVEDMNADRRGKTRRYYEGMPCTYVALFLPMVAGLGFINTSMYRIGMCLAVVTMGVAMVSPWRVRKPGMLAYGGFVALAIAATVVYATYNAALPNALQD